MNNSDSTERTAEAAHAPARLIRPYLITGGATEAADDVVPATCIQTTPEGHRDLGDYRWEAAQILEVADTTISVARLAALCNLPIGVARVVVSDLIDDGALVVHHLPSGDSELGRLEDILNSVQGA